MSRASEPSYDAASVVSTGKRACQEDAVLFDCPMGGETGLVVLSDGMGGHAAGDVASKIVLTEVFSELKLHSAALAGEDAACHDVLTRAALGANACIRAYIEDRPEAIGMGATLVAGVLHGDRLNWISIGDSPLYLFRGGRLERLNEDHSYGHTIDDMVASGLMQREDAARHPDRTCLTSVVGGGGIAQLDCPPEGIEVLDGDVLIFASDGIDYLSNGRIAAVVAEWQGLPSTAIAAQLLREIETLDDPDQDNVSIVVVKIQSATLSDGLQARRAAAAGPVVPARPARGVPLRLVDTPLKNRHTGERRSPYDSP